MIFKKGERIVMIGDSITDCGRARPKGQGRGALGSGYVSLVNAHLEAIRPDLLIDVINMGISGNTVRDLAFRWEEDVFSFKPDWVSIMIGINDVWRQFDNPARPETHVKIDEYRKTLLEIVRSSKKKGIKVILMTPYFIEFDRDEPMRSMMDDYGAVVAEIANREKTIFVDVQNAFDKVLRHAHPMIYAVDRVHPGLNGHLIIARAFLSAVGL